MDHVVNIDGTSVACHNCVLAKLKCQEEKPCQRCLHKGLVCELPFGEQKAGVENSAAFTAQIFRPPVSKDFPHKQAHVQPSKSGTYATTGLPPQPLAQHGANPATGDGLSVTLQFDHTTPVPCVSLVPIGKHSD